MKGYTVGGAAVRSFLRAAMDQFGRIQHQHTLEFWPIKASVFARIPPLIARSHAR